MSRIRTFATSLAATVLIMCCLWPPACQAAQPVAPPGALQDIFYAWVEKYDYEKLVNTAGPVYLHLSLGVNSAQYIQAIRRNLKKEGAVWRQSKQGVFDGVELPYLYIDERHSFLRFMPAYSDMEVQERIVDGPGYKKLKDIEIILESYYLKLLPLASAARGEYVLVVVSKFTDDGGENSALYIFRVKAQQQGQKVRYHFTMLVKGDPAVNGYGDLMEPFSVEDFRPALREGSQQDADSFRFMKYDVDKYTGDLLVFYGYYPPLALRYAWNGQRYVKKNLVEADWWTVWSEKRGQE